MLKPGGYLLYSTCTFSPEEDEGTAAWLLEQEPSLKIIDSFSFEGRANGRPDWIGSKEMTLISAYRMWPHRLKGEGHFAVLFQKEDGASVTYPERKRSRRLTDEAGEFLNRIRLEDQDGVYEEIGGKLYLVPKQMPELKGIRIVRSGLYLGDIKKKRFEPSQALAMAVKKEQYDACVLLSLDDERVIRYLKGETMEAEGPDGIVLVCVDG